MKSCVFLLAMVFLLCGCAGQKSPDSSFNGSRPEKKRGEKFIIAPTPILIGKVVNVNSQDRFAVLNFPVGSLPAVRQTFNVYRHGLKVGAVKVTGPQQEDNIVADIIEGEIQTGDELRNL